MIATRTVKAKEAPKTRFGGGPWFPWKHGLYQFGISIVTVVTADMCLEGIALLAEYRPYAVPIAIVSSLIVVLSFFVGATAYGVRRFGGPDKWSLR